MLNPSLTGLKCLWLRPYHNNDLTQASSLSPHLLYEKSAETGIILRWLQQASVEMSYSFSSTEPPRAQAFSSALDMIHRGHFRYAVYG